MINKGKWMLLFILVSCNNNVTKNEIESHKTYWEDGHNLQMEYFTIDGNRHGITKKYYPSGKIKYQVVYDNGKLVTINFVNDTLGRPLNFGVIKEGKGHVITYDDDGTIKSEGLYVNGYKNGQWIDYNYEGKINNKRNYKNGYLIINSSKTYDNQYD